MDLLKAELERKRKATEALKSTAGAAEAESGAKSAARFIRQKDRIEMEERRRREMQEELDRQRRERRKAEEVAESQSKKQKQETEQKTEEQKVDEIMHIPLREVKARLRAMRQPVTYFGETDLERRQRLIRLETEQTAADEGYALGEGHDIRNLFLDADARGSKKAGKASKEEDEDEDDDEDDDAEAKAGDRSEGNESSTGERTGRPPNVEVKFSEIPGIEPHKLVYKYFKSLIKQWEWDLNARSDQEKASMKGRQDTKRQKQCKDYIRSLFKLCKRKQVPPDILPNLVKIVEACERGNFREANDQYILIAIGNSPWPIGLTMVGIHERSGREKISTSKVAHIMNDEMQRKYLTSVKRLITYAQSKRDDVPPSMKVLT